MPSYLNKKQLDEALFMYKMGFSARDIGKALKVDKRTVHYSIRRLLKRMYTQTEIKKKKLFKDQLAPLKGFLNVRKSKEKN